MGIRQDRNQVFNNGMLVSEQVVEVDTTLETNRDTIQDRVVTDLGVMDLITSSIGTEFTQAGVRDLQRQVKDLARMNKRMARMLLKSFESVD